MDINNLDELDIPLPDEFDGLPVFLVGGRVRDTIRGAESSDTDLMVTETSPSEMKERGFREIDSDNNDTFGVFQDSLGREVSLPREEHSLEDPEDDNPHTAFDIQVISASTPSREAIELDLKRRDFAVNAMAYDIRYEVLHDPYNGVKDLEDEILRAVDYNAFKQDPLRVLRGARFAARLGFEIEDDTLGAMWEAVEEIESLPQERVKMEMNKALVQSDNPRRFFDILDEIGALDYTFPSLYALKSIPAGPPEYHEESADMFD